MKIEIRWSVEDGYVGKDRPQTTVFDSDDVMDEEDWEQLTEEEKQGYIHESVQDDFEQKITWSIDDYGLNE
jgi:hypothetical protein